MDEKKKTVSEEKTKAGVVDTKEEIMDFDDLRTVDSKDSHEKENKTPEVEKEDSKEEPKKDMSKEETKKEESKERDSKEETEKETSKEEIKEEDSKEKDSKEETEKETSKEEIKEEDSKEKDSKEETKKETSKEEKKENVSKNAISQSKRLADAKAAEQVKTKEASGDSKINKKKEASGGKKIFGIVFGCIASLLLIAYVAGFVYFSNYFYQDVAINGTSVSNMNAQTAKQTLDNFYKDYILTIETIDGKQVQIKGSDISMKIVLHDEFADCLKEQKAYLWFFNMFEHHDYSIAADASWNQEALDKIYKDLKMLDKKMMVAPKDAYIGIENNKFAIIKEVLGTTIKTDTFKAAVEDSLSKVVSAVNLKDAGCYELPKIYQDNPELSAELEAKKEFANGVINIQLDDLTLEPGMDLYDAVLEKKGNDYTISESLVKKYVKSLADEYDTMGKDRTFTTSFNDKTVEVTGTAFGYEMDQEATAKALYNALNAKKAATVEAVFKTKGYTLQGENDIGNTYIEVNLSEQRVIAYKNGKKVAEGDCVSGKEATGNGTCLGLYAIQDKLSPTVLRGDKKEVVKTVTKKNKKGKKVKVEQKTMEYEYESPVTFWLQFNGGFGLHDAAGWRSAYGGNIYYYSGSHGCVNLPYSLAETLYKNFEVGDPVVVYFWDNENRK